MLQNEFLRGEVIQYSMLLSNSEEVSKWMGIGISGWGEAGWNKCV